jgi:ADP-heptose:LPS heptosyltransferase
MTFRRRIFLDRFLAGPVAVACNALTRLLGRLLRRDHSIDPATTREVVVAKLVGLGSILEATPLLRALRQRFPHARLTFVSLESNRNLLERLEGVDEVLCLDDSSVLRMFWTTMQVTISLERRHLDHYFDLEVYSAFACLLSLFSLTRNRLGFYRHSNRFKKGIYTHLVYFNTRMPVRQLYLQLGRVAGVLLNTSDRLGTIRVDPSDRRELRNKLSTLGMNPSDGYILVNPNASDLMIERRWPEGHVLKALERLAGLGHNLVMLGAPSEAPFVQSLWHRVPQSLRRSIFNTAGLLTLGEALALIEGAGCVLTNDTGPMHMAFALGRPTVCLFGPAHPDHYGVDGPTIVSLYAPVPCSPCVHELDEPTCNGDNICMQRLSPDLVVSKVLALLSQGRSNTDVPQTRRARGTLRQRVMWNTETGNLLGVVIRRKANS